jgi:hypothetical protein
MLKFFDAVLIERTATLLKVTKSTSASAQPVYGAVLTSR